MNAEYTFTSILSSAFLSLLIVFFLSWLMRRKGRTHGFYRILSLNDAPILSLTSIIFYCRRIMRKREQQPLENKERIVKRKWLLLEGSYKW